jgi:hypothetical protein
MKRLSALAIAAIFAGGATLASAASFTFDFEDGTDQGFGTGFGNDASASFPIVNIGGSNRMAVGLGGFQVAGREAVGDAAYAALNAAANDPSGYVISYDWYIDTSLSPGNYGTFLQGGTYFNSGDGDYTQDFPGTGKDFEVDGTQLASGGVFSGTVTETLTEKYGVLAPGFGTSTFLRFGLILNGDGANTTVYFDNITIAPAIPEPTSLAIAALGATAIGATFRRRK